MTQRSGILASLPVIAACLCAGRAGATAIPLACTEPLLRAWTNEILAFRVEVPRDEADPARMRLIDDAGAAVPFQVSDPQIHRERARTPLTVSLVADFMPWQTRTWTLHCGAEERANADATDLQAARGTRTCELANARIAVRTGFGSAKFDTPAAADSVPPPIAAVRGPGGAWIGRGWIESPRRVTAYDIRLIGDGPIFKTVRAVYELEGGRYVCFVTLRTGEDVVHVREEFDLGPPHQERDSHFCFSLTPGLEPDTVRWYGRYYDERFNPAKAPVMNYREQREAVFPVDYADAGLMLRLHGLFVWWPQAACYYGAYRADDPDSDLVALFPRFPGNWRNPTMIGLATTDERELVVRAPIRQPEQEWTTEGVDYDSPYYTGVPAPGAPRSLGVREWGLLVARAADVIPPDDDFTRSGIRKAWTRYGQNPLDKIKHWTLDWEDPGAAAYPMGLIRRQDLPALRARVAETPALQKLQNDYRRRVFAYLVKDDPELGRALVEEESRDHNRRGLLPSLRTSVSYYLDTEGDLGVHTHMHHGVGHVRGAMPLFDAAMSIDSLTPEQRRETRALFAFLLYKLSDPDWLAYGSGFHLGNPNMPTAALSVLGQAAAVIPNHPMSAEWVMRSLGNITTMLRDYTSPGGAWRECPHYQMDAAIRFVIQSADVFRNTGFVDLYRNPYLKATMLYAAQIMTARDPRLGVRTLPAIGNGSHEPISLFGRMAAGTAKSDPEFSRWMQWTWQEMGSLFWYVNDELTIDPTLPAEPPDMSSRHFPGFGTVMRAHAGDPSETYLVFRMGRNHEHYENDQGSLVLYSRGAPLVLDFGSIYQPTMSRPWLHNRVSINHKVDWLNTGEVIENELLGSVDAALGRLTVDRLFAVPEDPWTKTPPNAGPAPETIDPVTWTRQVMLVKDAQPDGPHYVLVRDGFDGPDPGFTEWSLWCLANGVDADARTALYDGQHDVDLEVTVLEPAAPVFETGKYGHEFLYAPVGHFWRPLHPGEKFEEVQHFIRMKREDIGGYFAVLFPRAAGAQPPVFEACANGAGVRAELADDTHIAICADKPGTHVEGDVTLEGQRGLVRRSTDRLLLALLSGTSLRAGGTRISGAAPVSVSVASGAVRGEANLQEPAALLLTLASESKPEECVIASADGERTIPCATADGAVRIELPAGKCRFELVFQPPGR